MVGEGLRMKDGGWWISTLITLITLITRMTLITPMALMQRPEKNGKWKNGKLENWKNR